MRSSVWICALSSVSIAFGAPAAIAKQNRFLCQATKATGFRYHVGTWVTESFKGVNFIVFPHDLSKSSYINSLLESQMGIKRTATKKELRLGGFTYAAKVIGEKTIDAACVDYRVRGRGRQNLIDCKYSILGFKLELNTKNMRFESYYRGRIPSVFEKIPRRCRR